MGDVTHRGGKNGIRTFSRPGAAALGCALLLTASTASAQEWLSNRSSEEGPGVRLGQSLVFHPGVGVEGGYDTNVFYSDENTPGAGRLRISVNLDLATRPPQRRTDGEGRVQRSRNLEFRLGIAAAYNEYLSGLDVVQEHRNVDLNAGFDLNILPGRVFSVMISDTYVRSVQPQNEVGPRNFNRDYNDAQIYFQIAPGGGMFDLRIGYNLQLTYYEDSDFPGLQYTGNFLGHNVFANLRWRFLPKTALVFSGSFTPILAFDDGAPPPDTRVNHDQYQTRATVGLVGLLTRRFSLLLQAGYGGAYFTGGEIPYYETFIGRLELQFHITPTARLRFGYDRDFFPTPFSDYYNRDRVAATYSHLIAGRVLLELTAGFSYIDYSSELNVGGEAQDRRDPMVDVKLFADYRIRDWIAINATLAYLGNFTDFVATYAGTDPGSFQHFLALAGVRAMY